MRLVLGSGRDAVCEQQQEPELADYLVLNWMSYGDVCERQAADYLSFLVTTWKQSRWS